MNADKRYLFDLLGYLVIDNALTPEEVARCNAAIDYHADQFKEREGSLAGTSHQRAVMEAPHIRR